MLKEFVDNADKKVQQRATNIYKKALEYETWERNAFLRSSDSGKKTRGFNQIWVRNLQKKQMI